MGMMGTGAVAVVDKRVGVVVLSLPITTSIWVSFSVPAMLPNAIINLSSTSQHWIITIPWIWAGWGRIWCKSTRPMSILVNSVPKPHLAPHQTQLTNPTWITLPIIWHPMLNNHVKNTTITPHHSSFRHNSPHWTPHTQIHTPPVSYPSHLPFHPCLMIRAIPI